MTLPKSLVGTSPKKGKGPQALVDGELIDEGPVRPGFLENSVKQSSDF